jgi:hypothetical protein
MLAARIDQRSFLITASTSEQPAAQFPAAIVGAGAASHPGTAMPLKKDNTI